MDMFNFKMITESTTPLNIKPNDPGLLTLSQYYQLRNPDNKMHPDEAYVVDLESLNYRFTMPSKRSNDIIPTTSGQSLIRYDQHNGDIKILVLKDSYYSDDGKIVAVYVDGNWFYDPKRTHDNEILKSDVKGNLIKDKYPERTLENALIIHIKKENIKKFSKPFKRIKLDGEYFTFHHDNDYPSIVVINDDGLVVANASDEWGTTLLQVADEYKGKGIGSILGEVFIDEYNLTSGGYTPSGYSNASKIWNNRVSEFIQNGWYSELLKSGKIKRDQVNNIIKDFKSGKRKQEKVPTVNGNESDKRKFLCYIDDGISFILYDEKFLKDQDEKWIYGYTFLRDTDYESDIVYRFEYVDNESRKLLSYILLQSQRNNGAGINVKYIGSDYFEYDDLKYVELRDGMLYLTKDVLNIPILRRVEVKMRQSVDEYDEIHYLLREIADSKFD